MALVIEIHRKSEISELVDRLHHERPSLALGTLLAGDRWSCVADVVVAKKDGEIAGIATIAPKGEQLSGKPTIVAIYVSQEYRGLGIGYKLLETAIDYMLNQGLEPIHIDILNSKVSRMIARLPIEKQQKLRVADQSLGGLIDAMMEM